MHLMATAFCFLCVVSAFLQSHGRASPLVYNEHEAAAYVEYARAAFCDTQALVQWNCGESCQAASVVPGSVRPLGPGLLHGATAFVAKLPEISGDSEGSRCLVSFRGSINVRNWFSDAEAWTVSWPPASWGHNSSSCPSCRVHNGFSAAYEELRHDVIGAVSSLGCKSMDVSGHSLGAALAILAALDARLGRLAVPKVYLFGAPRVGNTAFAQTFEDVARSAGVVPPAWRIVHYHDPVPRLKNPFADYSHVSREVYYDSEAGGSYRVCADGLEDKSCSDSVSVLDCVGNLDHLMYLNRTFQEKKMSTTCVAPRNEFVPPLQI